VAGAAQAHHPGDARRLTRFPAPARVLCSPWMRLRLDRGLLGWALVLVSGLCPADVLIMKDGRRIEGTVTAQDSTKVKIQTSFGDFEFPMTQVDRIEKGKTSAQSFDERFSLANVASVLAGNGLHPKQAYYPSLSYLPQAAVLWCAEGLHRATGIAAFAIHVRGHRWSPTAYLLCRLTNVTFGGARMLMLLRLNRRNPDRIRRRPQCAAR